MRVFPTLYRKEYLKIDFENEKIKVMLYIMNPGRELSKPNDYYFNAILEDYKIAGFDEKILYDALN